MFPLPNMSEHVHFANSQLPQVAEQGTQMPAAAKMFMRLHWPLLAKNLKHEHAVFMKLKVKKIVNPRRTRRVSSRGNQRIRDLLPLRSEIPFVVLGRFLVSFG